MEQKEIKKIEELRIKIEESLETVKEVEEVEYRKGYEDASKGILYYIQNILIEHYNEGSGKNEKN